MATATFTSIRPAVCYSVQTYVGERCLSWASGQSARQVCNAVQEAAMRGAGSVVVWSDGRRLSQEEVMGIVRSAV
jgi:hypothetical protein